MLDTPKMSTEEVKSLIDLSAMVTGKYIPCGEIEQYYPPLDEALLKKVAFWACPQDIRHVKIYADIALSDTGSSNTWEVAIDYLKEDRIRNMQQVGHMISATVASSDVFFTFEKQQITSTSCRYCSDKLWCSHIIAAIMYRMKNAHKVSVHAPVTETLSSLNREQLQKLVQLVINDNPRAILGKVQNTIDKIRDTSSAISLTAGAPDRTFGLATEAESIWDLAVAEIGRSFKSACLKAGREFPYSFLETDIQKCWLYDRYLRKVVNLVHEDQVETAGKVLMVLAQTAADTAIDASGDISRDYVQFLKTIERMCCLYIIHFQGPCQLQLVHVCKMINKNLNVQSAHSKWAELPPVSSMFPFESVDVPGVLFGNQQAMFYEPLCVYAAPDPGRDLHELLAGRVPPRDSSYNEDLPMMMMRFEAIRLWKNSGCGKSELLRLAVVILGKLLRSTHRLSITSLLENFQDARMVTDGRKKRRINDENYMKTVPVKKSKVSPLTKNGSSSDLMSTKKATTSAISSSNVGTDLGANDTSLNVKVKTKKSETETNETKTKESATVTKKYDFEMKEPSTKERANDDKVQNLVMKEPPAKAKINTKLNVNHMNKLDAPTKQVEMHRMRIHRCLQSQLHSVREKEDLTDSNGDTQSEAILSLCMLHTCCCVYSAGSSLGKLSENEKELLILGTLRAFEFSRFRSMTGYQDVVINEERRALLTLEGRLMEQYRQQASKLLGAGKLTLREHMYMKLLSKCNRDGDCFFNDAHPLRLAHFLVKNTLQTSTPEGDELVLCLCLYTLCHSYSPDMDDGKSSDNRQWRESFSYIMSVFFDRIGKHSEKNIWLLKLMENYHEVNDRKILGYIWSRLKYLRLDGWQISLEVAVLRFILNFIKVENSTNSGQSSYNYDVYHKLIDLAKSLEMSFTKIVLGSWKDIHLYLPSSKVSYLVDLMRKYIPSNWSMSDAMVEAILDFFSDQFSHGVNSCLLLKLFPRGDVNLTKAYSIISENSAFYSSGALLQVANEHSEMLKSEQSIEYLPAGHVFSEYAERAIICALKKKDKHISDSAPRRGKGRIFPLENPDSNIQWVFRAFLDKPARAVVKSQQFKDITSLVAEAYNDDIKTILSLFECVKSHKIILDKCKPLLGLSIVGLVTAHTHDALKLIKHAYYKEFLAELERVQEYFCAYVVGGEKAFKNLLKEIKLKYKTKTKLLDNIKRKFTTS